MRKLHSRRSERGQAMILFALVLPVLLIMFTFVLDVGFSYFVSKKAQTAADAAALAAVNQALQQVGPGGQVTCATADCQSAGVCPGSGNLHNGCQYAAANGFSQLGQNGQQSLSIAAGTTQFAPNVPNIPVSYWTQVVAQQALPKWFSGLISSSGLSPAARATAALRQSQLAGSMYLLNHASDCFVSALDIGLVCGEDFLALGFNDIHTGGGIYMASSNASGVGLPGIAAGTIAVGGVTVQASFTYLMGHGGIQNILAGTNWNAAPKNGFTDASLFSDPMAGKGQPPPPTGLPDHPVPAGLITGALLGGAPTVLPPGNYYSTLPLLNTALGTPLTVTGNVIFSDGQNPPCGGFCNYVFYGGLITGVLSKVTFSPGRYVFAGAQPIAGLPGIGVSVGVNSVVQDLTPLSNGQITANTDAGEIFIFTNASFPGLVLPAAIRNSGLSFPQVQAGVSAGLNPSVTLHGLNASNAAVPAELQPFAPALIWQDQANTTLKYTSNGMLDLSCGAPCSNILSVPGSQQMIIQASQQGGHAGVNLFGMIYGPRGSWLTILGVLPGDTVAGPMQIITGALQMALDASLDIQQLPNPPTRLVAALVQ
jgi:hypothetical protein